MDHTLGSNTAKRQKITILILSFFATGLYVNTIGHSFVFDDTHQIVNNPWIRDFDHLGEIFQSQVWAFQGKDSPYYRPLMHVFFSVLYIPFGPNPLVFHLANVLLNALVTVLVFFFASRILPGLTTGKSWFMPSAAMVAGLIFAAHPVHTEAVAWVSGLPDLACAIFYLLGILLFLRSLDNPKRHPIAHGLGALCYLASALFKEPGVTLPAVIILMDLAIRFQGRNAKFWATRYGFLFIGGGIYLFLRISALGGFFSNESVGISDPTRILAHMGTATWWYIAMLIAPVRLNAFHTLDSATGLPSMAALVGIPIACALAVIRRSVPWTAATALFLIPLIPALYAPGILPGLDNPWTERYLYLPSVGYVMGIGILYKILIQPRSSFHRSTVVILAIGLLIFSIATVRRNSVWKSDLTLWTDTVRKSPNSWAAHSYLGYALFSKGDTVSAIEEYKTAIKMNPDSGDAHHNLGVALAVIGQHEEAAKSYSKAITLNPRDALFRANLSISLTALGRRGEAIREAAVAIELDPRCSKAYNAQGVALGNMGRIAEAAESFRYAIRLDPNDSNSRANLEKARRYLDANQKE